MTGIIGSASRPTGSPSDVRTTNTLTQSASSDTDPADIPTMSPRWLSIADVEGYTSRVCLSAE